MGGVTTTPLATNTIKKEITDQTYNPKSENAQSGKAVAEALTNHYTKDEVDNLDAIQSISILKGDVHINSDYDVNVGGSLIRNVGAPIDTRDAATKGYVDGLMGDIESLLGGI